MVVLLITAVLVSVAIPFSRESRIELALSGHALDRFGAYRLVWSGYRVASGVLRRDTNDYDAFSDLWGRSDLIPVAAAMISSKGRISGSIADENAKININALRDAQGRIRRDRENQLRSLFQVLQLDEQPVESLLDWLDADNKVRIGGAEETYYRGLNPPYRCANGPLETLGQLFLIKGWTPELLLGTQTKPGLLRFLTLHSDERININTAPAVVLETLDASIDETLAQAIVSFRSETPFKHRQDLKRVPGVDALLFARILSKITVKSSFFSIHVQAVEGTARMHLLAVVHRAAGRVIPLYWRVGA